MVITCGILTIFGQFGFTLEKHFCNHSLSILTSPEYLSDSHILCLNSPIMDAKPDQAPPDLTPREQEMLKFLLEGISPKAIATNLGVSNKTVDYHKGNLYRKLGIQSMHELLVLFANKEIPESILATEMNVSLPKEFVPAVYKNWTLYNDETSSANLLVKSKGIYVL